MLLSWQIKRVLLTLVILGVLGAQLIASFRHTNKTFPFMWYPMYSPAHFEGERIPVRHSIYAAAANGKRYYIHPVKDLRVEFWRYERIAAQLLVNDVETSAAAISVIRKLHPDVIELQIEDYPMMITRDGPKPAPRKIVNRISLAPADGRAK
jgi:hypothetical protein